MSTCRTLQLTLIFTHAWNIRSLGLARRLISFRHFTDYQVLLFVPPPPPSSPLILTKNLILVNICHFHIMLIFTWLFYVFLLRYQAAKITHRVYLSYWFNLIEYKSLSSSYQTKVAMTTIKLQIRCINCKDRIDRSLTCWGLPSGYAWTEPRPC